MNNTIALLTDFGNTDIYVGAMKGVMLRIAPGTRFIDITHSIEPQNVRQAAIALMNAYRYFAEDTTFLVVVDPGVGSTRKPIAVRAGSYTFVAPDNGVLTYALSELGDVEVIELTNKVFWLAETSATFHGRDIFAPVAAYINSGTPWEKFGEPLDEFIRLPAPELIVGEKRIRGEITHIDRFGNIISSIGAIRWLTPERMTLEPRFGDNKSPVPLRAEEVTIKISGKEIPGLRHAYSDAHRGELVAVIGSSGYLEVAVNQGNAATSLDVVIGDHLDLYTGTVE